MPKPVKIRVDAAKNILEKLIYPALGLAAVGGVVDLGKPIVRAVQIADSRKKLIDYTPALEGVDEKKVDDYFGVVKTYSPTSAKNPIVAGDLVNKMVQFGGVDHNLVKSLVDIERGSMSTGFGTDILNKGTGKVLGSVLEAAAFGE